MWGLVTGNRNRSGSENHGNDGSGTGFVKNAKGPRTTQTTSPYTPSLVSLAS